MMPLLAEHNPTTWSYVVLEIAKLLFGFLSTAFAAWIAIKQLPQNTAKTIEVKDAIDTANVSAAEKFDAMQSQVAKEVAKEVKSVMESR